MSEVGIRLAVGGIRLEFRGRRAFFERIVEPIVEAAYQNAARRGRPVVVEASVGVSPGTELAPDQAQPPPAEEHGAEGSGAEQHVVAGAEAAPTTSTASEPVFHPTSPAQFNQYAGQVGHSAATVDQRIMAFAFYLWNYERQEAFEAADMEAFFRTVQHEPPSELEVVISTLADSKRFLEPGPSEGQWRLTSKGVNYVKNRLLTG